MNLYIWLENSAEGLGFSRECYWSYVVSVLENTPKNLLVQGRVQLEHSSHIVRLVSRLHANTSIADVYWRKRLNWWAHLDLCHRSPDILESVLNHIVLSNSTAGNCVPMQIIKEPAHGRTLTTEEQKWSSFQANYDQ